MLGLPFEDDLAKKLNNDIFETIYFAAMTASKDMAKDEYKEELKKLKEQSQVEDGLGLKYTAGAYSSFVGSPLSNGIFQFDMWGVKAEELSGRWDWEKLRKEVVKYGVKNSLLLAPMPTASTAQILGNNECFEPYTSNLYKRNVLSGEFIIVNKHLVLDLIDLGLWNDEIRINIMKNNGSVQGISEIPENIREVYKTVWEMKSANIIDMAADRGKFICQSQSMNLFMRDVNVAKLNKALFYGWNKGLKTGMYYLRSNAKSEARKSLGIDDTITSETSKVGETSKPKVGVTMSDSEIEVMNNLTCSLDNPENCEYCSS
jgi:ribonucleoside-diphosphate reductase alpha chain